VTPQGIVYLSSIFYLTGVICFSISLNENEAVGTILRETVRRWIKFLILTAIIGGIVLLASL